MLPSRCIFKLVQRPLKFRTFIATHSECQAGLLLSRKVCKVPSFCGAGQFGQLWIEEIHHMIPLAASSTDKTDLPVGEPSTQPPKAAAPKTSSSSSAAPKTGSSTPTVPQTAPSTSVMPQTGPSTSTVPKTGSSTASAPSSEVPNLNTDPKITEAKIKVVSKKKDISWKPIDRKFITTMRAMNEYLLKPSDLEGLRKTSRRSPFEDAPPITVYLRKDVEAKAIEAWGSAEALQRELDKRREMDQKYRDYISEVKKMVKAYKQTYQDGDAATRQARRDMAVEGSRRVVMTAVLINACNCLFKFFAWLYTGSHSLFSETIHSLADTCNQLILAFGIRKSIQRPNEEHPYGYTNMRYVASLISGVGIFFFGTGLSFYHGIMGLLNPVPLEPFYWAYFILGGSLVSEGGTLLVAYNAAKKGASDTGMTLRDYIVRGQDPSINVVLMEDIAAVLGVTIAASCMGLSSYLGSHIPDVVGSFLIGGLLGGVAWFIILTNSAALVGRSIPPLRLSEINKELENDNMIRAIHDTKCIDMGNGLVRYKAEVDFDGRELTRSYLDSQDLDLLLEEMRNTQTIVDVQAFILKHGENMIDLVGAEIDRIESQLKKRHPEIRYCDLELL